MSRPLQAQRLREVCVAATSALALFAGPAAAAAVEGPAIGPVQTSENPEFSVRFATHQHASLKARVDVCAPLLALRSGTGEATSRDLSARQREVHHDLRVHCHRFAVQHVWLVAPLLYGFNGGRGQHRVTADQLQVLDRTVLADLRLQ